MLTDLTVMVLFAATVAVAVLLAMAGWRWCPRTYIGGAHVSPFGGFFALYEPVPVDEPMVELVIVAPETQVRAVLATETLVDGGESVAYGGVGPRGERLARSCCGAEWVLEDGTVEGERVAILVGMGRATRPPLEV